MEYYQTAYPLAQIQPDLRWEAETTSWSDEVQAVAQSMPLLRAGYRHAFLPRAERPIRVRTHPDNNTVKLHQNYLMSSVVAPQWTPLDSSGQSPSSSPMTIIKSSGSSAGTPWTASGQVEDVADEDESLGWDAKHYMVEENGAIGGAGGFFNDFPMSSFETVDIPIKGEPSSLSITASPDKPVKRPRGRPRKYPKPEPGSKRTNTRSKTGCLTCRSRKKKCDEVKPICIACERNGLDCTFPEVRVFRSNAEKQAESRGQSVSETEEDPLPKSSDKPTTSTDKTNLQELPVAPSQQPSTSSITSFPLPGIFPAIETDEDRILFKHYCDHLSHLLVAERGNDNAFTRLVLPVALFDKGLMHSMLSLAGQHINCDSSWGKGLLEEFPHASVTEIARRSQYHVDNAYMSLKQRTPTLCKDNNLSAAKLQLMFGILYTLNDHSIPGGHRPYFTLYQELCKFEPETPENPELKNLVAEFSGYHICADQFICLPTANSSYLEKWDPSSVIQPGAVNLLGITDGLFIQLSRITRIRNRIRDNLRSNQANSTFDYQDITEANNIDKAIEEWKPSWPSGDHRDAIKPLYTLMTWIYLYRTIQLPEKTNWELNPKLVEAVDEAIKMLLLVEPKSGLQTFLLMPSFMIGCAAFYEGQRKDIRSAIGTIKAYTGFKNADTALTVLEEVWRLMDAKDPISWDWQHVAHHMGKDFLAT